MLAERIWFIYRQLANTLIADPVGRMYGVLLMHLEKNRVPLDRISYTFDFGLEDLAEMIGVSYRNNSIEWQSLLEKIIGSKNLQLLSNRIHVKDVRELRFQNDAFKRLQTRSGNKT
jgi:hypothetical protein